MSGGSAWHENAKNVLVVDLRRLDRGPGSNALHCLRPTVCPTSCRQAPVDGQHLNLHAISISNFKICDLCLQHYNDLQTKTRILYTLNKEFRSNFYLTLVSRSLWIRLCLMFDKF